MRSRRLSAVVLMGSVAFGAALPAVAAAQGVRAQAVHLDTGHPIAGARWWLEDSTGTIVAIGMSRGTASLALQAPAPRVYTLHFAAVGFARHATPRIPLDAGEQFEYVHIARPTMDSWPQARHVATADDVEGGEGVLAGTVRDAATHEPVQHAQATARTDDSPALGVAMTDARGRFRLPVSSGGPIELSIRALGYTPTRLQLTDAQADLDIRLAPSAVLLDRRTTIAEGIRVRGVDARSLAGWVIDSATIAPLRGITQNVGDMLRWRSLPGVTVSRSGECISIRQLPCVLIVMNDVPIGDVSTIPVESVRSMVLLRSVEAMNLFGSRALGGALIVQTR